MAIPISLVLLGFFVMDISMVIEGVDLDRNSFPDDFVFGAATSAYQVEGAWNEYGKGPSIWDTFTHKRPEKIVDRSNADEALDQYHRYKEDIAIMKRMGMDAYRFSISWPRVLPNGKLNGGVNRKGIEYYNNLIDYLISEDLQPFVTLFHWDVPQRLEDEYGGFLSPRIVLDFKDFVELCFEKFGDRVKHWTTLNEPYMFSANGYNGGTFAPGRCSAPFGNCYGGDSAKEPYIVAHNLLLAHGAAVKLYKDKYQAQQKGKIGITLVSHWFVAKYKGQQHNDAAQRALDFMLGWFMDPLVYGRYPISMQFLVKDRLPKFSKRESAMVKGSYDFIGINYYTAYYASVPLITEPPSLTTDVHANLTTEKNGIPIGPETGSSWLHVYPKGIQELLTYINRTYESPTIYITENGVSEINNSSLPLEVQLKDNLRIEYYTSHLSRISEVIKEGVDVRGYFTWSLLDTFEFGDGYTVRFGIYYVDSKTLERFPKESSKWFMKFLDKKISLVKLPSLSVDDH